MSMSFSPEQIAGALAAVVACVGWLIIQWRKSVDGYNELHKNFYKLLRDETKAMAEMVDAELRNLHSRIAAIRQNMSAIADQLLTYQQSAATSLPEFERLASELYVAETELSAVTHRTSEVERRKRDTQYVLTQLSSDAFDRKKYEEDRASFIAQTPIAPPIHLTLPSPSANLKIGLTKVSPEVQRKLQELESHARKLGAIADRSLHKPGDYSPRTDA